MAVGDFFYRIASGFGIAADGTEVCGVLDGYGIAGQEFSGDGSKFDTRDLIVQFLDGNWRFVWGADVAWRTENDNRETHRRPRRRREEQSRGDGTGRPRLAAGCVSAGFSVFVLCDACGSALPASHRPRRFVVGNGGRGGSLGIGTSRGWLVGSGPEGAGKPGCKAEKRSPPEISGEIGEMKSRSLAALGMTTSAAGQAIGLLRLAWNATRWLVARVAGALIQ